MNTDPPTYAGGWDPGVPPTSRGLDASQEEGGRAGSPQACLSVPCLRPSPLAAPPVPRGPRRRPPSPLPSPPAPGARATSIPSPFQGRVRRARRTSPAGLGRGVLGSALRSPRLQLQLCSDAAPRSPPPPPQQQFGAGVGGASRDRGASFPARPLTADGAGPRAAGGPHPASPPTRSDNRSRRRALCAPLYRSGTENPRRGGLGSAADHSGPGGDPAV